MEIKDSPAEMEPDADVIYSELESRLYDAIHKEFTEEEILMLREWGLLA